VNVISKPLVLADAIVAAFSNDQCFLFAGAGTAARAGLTTWFSYIECLATVADKYEPLVAQLMRKYLQSNLLLEAAHLYKTCPAIPVGELYAKLAEPFGQTKYDPTALLSLVSLPFAGIVTTNYDRSLHDALAKAKKITAQCVELNDPTLKEALYWSTFYIGRIHGRAEVPRSIVLDADDYKAIYANAEYQDFLHHVLTQKTCLFIGFSFLDPAIDRILSYIAEKGVQPKKHYALVPPVQDGLVEKLAKYNVEVVLYDPENNHSLLWQAIEGAEKRLRSKQTAVSESLPSGFDTAKRLLAVCYARAKMEGSDVTALRLIVIQGIVLSELGRGNADFSSLSEALRQYFPLSPEEAKVQVGSAISTLQEKGFCERQDTKIIMKTELPPEAGQSAITPLVNGIIARLKVREGYEVTDQIRRAIGNITEEVIVLRGFDLGAEFSGAEISEELDPRPTINAAINRHLKGFWQDRKRYIAEAFVDLLRHPDSIEEGILAELGRVSFGIEVVLQAGRSTMYSLSLPEVIYLETSVVLPAIVSGHPYQASYMDAIKRLQEASRRAGKATSVLLADVFLDEILHHRRKATEMVSELSLDSVDILQRRVLYYGAERVNVFISGYSSWLKSAKGEPSFDSFLEAEAPYTNKEQLKAFLQERGMTVVNSHPRSETEVKLQQEATNAVLQGYDVNEAGLEQWERKANVLKKHEGSQIALMKAVADKGRRVLLITADKLLRRAVTLSRYSYLRDMFMSPRNLVQLVDLLVGVEVNPNSLSRLLWTVRLADERAAIKDYLISRALPHYNAALLLKMNDLLDGYVEQIVKEAKLEAIDLVPTRTEQKIATSKFMDRVEDQIFESLAEEVKKLEARLKELEAKEKA
jgi:hypothetical protein